MKTPVGSNSYGKMMQDVIVWMQQWLLWTSGVVGGAMTHFPFLPAFVPCPGRHCLASHSESLCPAQSSLKWRPKFNYSIKLVVIWSVKHQGVVLPSLASMFAYCHCLIVEKLWSYFPSLSTDTLQDSHGVDKIKRSHFSLLQRAGANFRTETTR